MLTHLLASALALIGSDPSDGLLSWGHCLQLEALLAGREEPEAEVAVARAMRKCSRQESAARSALVEGVALATGDRDYAEQEGDTMVLAMRVQMTADLLNRARRAYSVAAE